MSEVYPTGKRYDTPSERLGHEPNSVIGRGLDSYAHDPAAVMARIESQYARVKTPETGEVAETAAKVEKRTAQIAVADVVLPPNKDEYWDDAPNNLAPSRNNSYTSVPAPQPPVADRFNPDAYMGRAPQLSGEL